MQGFLLDSHVPAGVVPAVQHLSPDCVIDHLASWHGGILLHASDEQILFAALAHDLALVTYDVSTIPPILQHWSAAGRRLPTTVFVLTSTIPQGAIGSLARGLVQLHRHPEQIDPAYPVVYLQPARE